MTNGHDSSELLRVGYYMAPDDPAKIVPREIERGEEKIEIITGGRVWFDTGESGDRRYGRGTIFRHIGGDRTVHRSDPEAPYRCLVLSFKGVGGGRPPRVSFWTTAETLSVFRREVISAFHNPDVDRDLLGDYLRATVEWHSRQSLSVNGAREVPIGLRRAIDYLDNHPETNVSIETLASISGYGKAHFHGLFRRHVGSTPHQYHLRQRLRVACEKLTSEKTSVADVAAAVGFDSLEHFHRSFKRFTGSSPGSYRKGRSYGDDVGRWKN